MAYNNTYRQLRNIAISGRRSAKDRLRALCALAAGRPRLSKAMVKRLLADPNLPAKITLWLVEYNSEQPGLKETEETERRLRLKKELEKYDPH